MHDKKKFRSLKLFKKLKMGENTLYNSGKHTIIKDWEMLTSKEVSKASKILSSVAYFCYSAIFVNNCLKL